jgi:hypothetical protein
MQNVEGRVVIAIQNKPAFVALVDANTERLSLSRFAPATGTDLGRSAWVHRRYLPASFCRFAGEGVDELTPSRIVHALGETRSGESSDVQVFDCNVIVLPHKAECGLEMKVSPRPLDAPMLAGEDANHFPASVAAALSLADSPLRSLQLGFSGAKMSGVRNCGSVAGSEESRQSDIDANLTSRGRQQPGRNILTEEGHEPIAARITAKRDGLDLSFDRSREEQPQPANPLQCQIAAINSPPCLPERQTVVPSPPPETRVTSAPKEPVKGKRHTLYDVSQNLGVDGGELRPISPDEFQLRVLIESSDRDAAHAPSITPLLNRRVVQLATQSQLPFGLPRHRWRKLRLETKASDHTSI